MAKKLMGFEGELSYNATAGTPADTVTTMPRDLAYGIESEFADISDRTSIVALSDVAQLSVTLEFELNNHDTDPFVALIKTAVISGGAVSLKSLDKNTGKGIDGDFVVSVAESQNLTDAQRLNVTCQPTDKEGRPPTLT